MSIHQKLLGFLGLWSLFGALLGVNGAWAQTESVSDSLLYPSKPAIKAATTNAVAPNSTSKEVAMDSLYHDGTKTTGPKSVAPQPDSKIAQTANSTVTSNKSLNEASPLNEAPLLNEPSSKLKQVEPNSVSKVEPIEEATSRVIGKNEELNSTNANSIPENFGLENHNKAHNYRGAEPISMGKFVLYSLGVLGLIFLLAWFLRRLRLVPGARGGNLGVVTALAVGTKEKLVLVQVGDEQLLIGVTPNNVNLVYKLPTPLNNSARGATKAEPKASSQDITKSLGFKDLLAKIVGENKNSQSEPKVQDNNAQDAQ